MWGRVAIFVRLKAQSVESSGLEPTTIASLCTQPQGRERVDPSIGVPAVGQGDGGESRGDASWLLVASGSKWIGARDARGSGTERVWASVGGRGRRDEGREDSFDGREIKDRKSSDREQERSDLKGNVLRGCSHRAVRPSLMSPTVESVYHDQHERAQ